MDNPDPRFNPGDKVDCFHPEHFAIGVQIVKLAYYKVGDPVLSDKGNEEEIAVTGWFYLPDHISFYAHERWFMPSQPPLSERIDDKEELHA